MPGPLDRTGANLRVSDAERNDVAEALAKHYGDGRLDAAEYQERLDRAMSAKTRADLSGLLTDLPRIAPAERVPAPRRQRISDAERNEVAEVLSKHYGDGRLDAAEFQERLDRAMGAKTRADLSGLLTDLPRITPAEKVPVPRRRPRAVVLIAALLAVTVAWSAVVGSHLSWFLVPRVPWLLIALVVYLVWRRSRFHHGHYHRRALEERPW